ncbi:TMEM175 family protein [Rubellimicrobium roseum]|uniref:DUF1211 domain-containing protein n=1 Tax=Rubellimicrobium roseum TaxID=687525 RepID=A0A5C4NL17_9RHOB|nr:TMEM175 family protein [Rubellimicrobium roseum]TNC73109.1 DUF1211 domain-containing protein [Rubellimicrobium roseum]
MAVLFRTGHSEVTRIEAFTDGVMAIVITLLMLEVKLPEMDLEGDTAIWWALTERLPIIFAWILSLAFVLVFWVAHHGLMRQLRHADRGFLWLNGLFLLAISFVPFPTGLFGEFPGSVPATFLLSLAMLLAATSFSLMHWYASRPGDLLAPEVPLSARRKSLRRSLLAPALATAILVAVPVLFFVPLGGPTPKPSD